MRLYQVHRKQKKGQSDTRMAEADYIKTVVSRKVKVEPWQETQVSGRNRQHQ